MVESEALSKSENQFARGSDLRKRMRIREAIIVGFLFFCGALSIFTTIGIVYELGSESLLFFTRVLWENTNHTLTMDIAADDTRIEVSRTGSALQAGMMIRFAEEVMGVDSVDGTLLRVTRGLEGTYAVGHTAGTTMFAGDKVTLREFFTGTRWNPQIGEFGILPLINATLMTSLIAMLVALPLGLSVAIYLSEYATERMRSTLKPVLEVLAGIPTVVYGYFALTFMTPILRGIFGREVVEIYNTASAGIVIGILILPLVSSMSEDALNAVPRSLREAAYGLGATRLETAVKVVVPAAFSGIAAAFIVAVSRAIGETMIVAIAAGAGPSFTFNPFESAETMTGHIVRISGGDLSYNSIDYNSIFAIGLVLFFMTLLLNIISQRVVKRYREVYE
ncbi:MAG: phosphate ABC transporter permease subunit PstC [Anaerolineales bacterium]|jgi:phosphate transport system permease protein